MRQKSNSCPRPKTTLTLILEPDELDVLDRAAAVMEVTRKDVLMRGLYLLDAAGLLMTSPADAMISVGVAYPPASATRGARFSMAG